MESAATMKYTDKSLIDAHRRGDPDAFGEIVRRYGDGILGYLTKMTGDKERAEDLFQETFKRVHEKSDTLRGDGFKSWLYKIATNAAYDGFRKDKQLSPPGKKLTVINENEEELASPVIADNSSNPSVVTVKAEQAEQVRQAVNSLPDRQRATLVLAYYQQLSYSEVALALDCSIGTVKTQMFRALRTLAEKLPEVEL
jgi:RNA polymerase sigma-70 factor, ECF subfamily